MAISDAILKKQGRLDDAERDVMKQHTIMGARLFSDRYSEFDHRAYKKRWDETQVLEELKACFGTFFDPEVVELFFSCIETI